MSLERVKSASVGKFKSLMQSIRGKECRDTLAVINSTNRPHMQGPFTRSGVWQWSANACPDHCTVYVVVLSLWSCLLTLSYIATAAIDAQQDGDGREPHPISSWITTSIGKSCNALPWGVSCFRSSLSHQASDPRFSMWDTKCQKSIAIAPWRDSRTSFGRAVVNRSGL